MREDTRHAASLYQTQWPTMKKARRWYVDMRRTVETAETVVKEFKRKLDDPESPSWENGLGAEYYRFAHELNEIEMRINSLPDTSVAMDYLAEDGERLFERFSLMVPVATGRNPDAKTLLFYEQPHRALYEPIYLLDYQKAKKFISDLLIVCSDLRAIINREMDIMDTSVNDLRNRAVGTGG